MTAEQTFVEHNALLSYRCIGALAVPVIAPCRTLRYPEQAVLAVKDRGDNDIAADVGLIIGVGGGEQEQLVFIDALPVHNPLRRLNHRLLRQFDLTRTIDGRVIGARETLTGTMDVADRCDLKLKPGQYAKVIDGRTVPRGLRLMEQYGHLRLTETQQAEFTLVQRGLDAVRRLRHQGWIA